MWENELWFAQEDKTMFFLLGGRQGNPDIIQGDGGFELRAESDSSVNRNDTEEDGLMSQ